MATNIERTETKMVAEILEYWLPSWYASIWILASMAIALVAGYELGRMREQLALLEVMRPEV